MENHPAFAQGGRRGTEGDGGGRRGAEGARRGTKGGGEPPSVRDMCQECRPAHRDRTSETDWGVPSTFWLGLPQALGLQSGQCALQAARAGLRPVEGSP